MQNQDAIYQCQKKVSKFKKLPRKKTPSETTVYFRYVKAISNSGEILKCVANNISKNTTMKITERSREEE